MNESSIKRNVFVGLFIMIGIGFLIAGILIIGDLHKTFENKIKVVSFFDDVSGLQKGNNIWLSGVKVGTVSELSFHKKSAVKVSILIDENVCNFIPKDSKVKLSSDGLIGNRILVIYGGSEDARAIQSGDTLRVEKTFSPEDMLNTLQKSNENLLAITQNFKSLSNQLANGEGSVGKMLNDNTLYDNINAAVASLQLASKRADKITQNLSAISANLDKEGTLINELTTDTVTFNSLKVTVQQLQQLSDSASVFITTINQEIDNPNSSLGILLKDEEAGSNLKETIKNLESSSKKLDEDLEALQHSSLLKKYFKKKAKEASNK